MKKVKKSAAISIVVLSLCIWTIHGIALLSQTTDAEAFRYRIEAPDLTWMNNTLSDLTLREKIGQLIQVRVRGEFINREDSQFKELLRNIQLNHLGGVVLFAGNVYESALLLNELQAHSKLPLLVSADFERGAAFRIDGTTSFPWTMAVGATGSEEFAYQQGMITAQESRALGVHWIFAPVMDVNNNPDNPVINIRSFGEDPQLVSRMGSAFIRGARAGGVLTTAKHFPGHGDTSVDTHIGLAVVPSGMERLQSLELVPFKSAVHAGVDAIMTAHVAIPKITEDPEIPATLSPVILTDLLREQLQFEGLIVTDALEMGGITNKYWGGLAAVEAVKAGADIVLLPTDANVAINEIERAVHRGDISLQSIDTSVKRILKVKSSLRLQKERTVDVEHLGRAVSSPQNEELAQKIADHSITAIKDSNRLLPVDPVDPPEIFSLILDSGLDTSPGSVFQSEMRKVYPTLIAEWANARIPKNQMDRIERKAKNSDLIICSTFARLSSGRNISAIPAEQQTIIKKLLGTGKPLILILFGNPYALEHIPEIDTYLCTFSYSDVSQRAAAKAISGEIPISGSMPVSIPGHAKAGEGLQIPKLEMVLKQATGDSSISSSNTFNNTREVIDYYVKSGTFSNARLKVGHAGTLALNVEYFIKPKDSGLDTPAIEFTVESGRWNSSFGVIISAMLATETRSLLLNAPVGDYLPEYRDFTPGALPILEILENISSKHLLPEGEISNLRLLEEIVLRASGSMDQLLSELPVQIITNLSPNQAPGSTKSFSVSARDIPILLQTLLNNGIYNHKRILKPSTIVRFTAPGNRRPALGWRKPSKNDWTGRLFSPDSFGCMDENGLFIWVDPKKDLFVILEATTGTTDEESEYNKAYENILKSVLNETSSP